MNKIEILRFSVSLGKYQDFVDQIISKAKGKTKAYVCIASVHQLMEAHADPSFAKISHQADIVTPDGLPITWALQWLYNVKQDRVAGMDLLPDLLKESQEKGLSVFFYGSTQTMLDKTSDYLQKEYPGLTVAGLYSPPFRPLTTDEESDICAIINNSGANMVFVVLGCPKQEKWMAAMKSKINATLVGVGGALPVLVGLQKRAPVWMQKSGLEWFFRLGQEPGRLWKRYLVTNSQFIYYIIAERFKPKSNERIKQKINSYVNPINN
jgi:N-acetylglucosaminyldiphosphoundecaprenol N-acetyl-beta-D-mannosaminyltransferase